MQQTRSFGLEQETLFAEEESEQRDDDNSDAPTCSVLNTVVDHVMISPTALEPDEFHADTEGTVLSVPVLRVFGPIIRRDISSSTTSGDDYDVPSPQQSACLHIHGAFPYLVCRPRAAGADGSLTRSTPNDKGHIDWDSASAVERILPILHENLEMAIQSSILGKSTDDPNSIPKQKKLQNRVIRQLSVVVGRGFYTFCPGPPAPFLRVEYYDPKMRWRVKMILERGLELGSLYHPDPKQYDSTPEMPPPTTDSDSAALQFHCYEAHIPYTMQVFKDYNLSGLSYIHVNNVRFRDTLPSSIRPSYTVSQSEKSIVSEHHLFLSSNTPAEWRWPQQTTAASPTGGKAPLSDTPVASQSHAYLQQQSPGEYSAASDLDAPINSPQQQSSWILSTPEDSKKGQVLHPPLKRETTCDVELDVHVSCILNVNEVMTDLSSTQAQERVHWRAVPSLQEIWTQERQRMSKLLPPKDDFLSPNRDTSTPPFTLNVKRDANLPGARLAAKGMERLRSLTQGLESEYRRAIGDIVGRHAEEVASVDKRLREGVKETQECGNALLTPDDDETLLALETLGSSFGREASGDHNALIHANGCFTPSSQESSQQVDEDDDEVNEELLSQCIDRGDSVLSGPFRHVEDFIDPETLTPFNLSDDDGDNANEDDEAGLERELDVLATQTFEYSNSNTTPATTGFGHLEIEGISSGFESAIEFTPSHRSSSPGDDADGAAFETLKSAPPEKISSDGESSSVPIWSHSPGILIEPVVLPPLRVSCKDLRTLNLLPMSNGAHPTWMPSSPACLIRREQRQWSPVVPLSGTYVNQTCPPPSRISVQKWSARNGHLTKPKDAKPQGRNSEPKTTGDKANGSALRKTLSRKTHVEEVEWNPSQPMMSLTPASQSQAEPLGPLAADNNPNGRSCSSCDPGVESSMSTSPKLSDGTWSQENALSGIGNQGGRIWIEGGGQLKSKTKPSQMESKRRSQGSNSESSAIKSTYLPTPVTIMVIEIHVQCRTGRAGLRDAKKIAMHPDPDRDSVSSVAYVLGKDPGGGCPIEITERGCLFVPVGKEISNAVAEGLSEKELFSKLAWSLKMSLPKQAMGRPAPLYVGCVRDEKQLLLRIGSFVYSKDPDALVSWDTQGAGLGYLVERGKKLDGNNSGTDESKKLGIDMSRLFGRCRANEKTNGREERTSFQADAGGGQSGGSMKNDEKAAPWSGSGLGSDWDDRVGAGAAAASIVSQSASKLVQALALTPSHQTGRLVFAGWKLIAEEVKHPNASYLPAVVSTVLDRRIPHHDNLVLTNWYSQEGGRERWRVIHHKLTQATACLLLLDALDIVGRAGEAARLSGVEFSQSFPGIRGSQYKVEGVLLRALQSLNAEERGSKKGRRLLVSGTTSLSNDTASQTQSPWKKRRRLAVDQDSSHFETIDERPVHQLSERGYFFFSPSLSDTTKQEALEVQALTLEPQSGHQTEPVVVCDFTALYPSLVIAYNLCYSTCAGRLEYHSTRSEMKRCGRTVGKLGPFSYSERRTATVLRHHLKSLSGEPTKSDRMYVAPTGTMFVAESVVKGVLPQVLDELLSTRAMLKKAAKAYKSNVVGLSPSILRQLEARQLALKYVANVTYGYTSATFSGRCAMPVLADTIVECGRRTLHSAIDMVNEWGRNSKGKWSGCEVIYGDTDSLFIRLPGRSVKEAFCFGEEVCKAVTASNPPPVQLKLEKVYQGCIMQTKKKYVGMKYESKDQQAPTFEAKGIETIRRDQAPITQKILRNTLISLFKHGPDATKEYLFRQWCTILSGSLPVSDFILTGRVRSRYRGGKVGPVQAVLARRLAEADPGKIVRHKERIAYVIVATPGVTFKLKDCVLTPMELLEQWDAYTIHTGYYITKHVNAALQRCLGLAPHRIDVNRWYEECPKPRRRIHFWPTTRSGSSLMISSYFGSDSCSICGLKCKANVRGRASVCAACRARGASTIRFLHKKLGKTEEEALRIAKICSNCNGCFEDGRTFAVETKSGPDRGTRATPGGVVTPLANCTCIDCPHTFERHRLREAGVEARAVCAALELF